MHSLYHALLTQHPRQLTSVRCAEQTIAQLHRYFEDVVLENNLAALVIESLPLMRERSQREMARIREIGSAAYKTFFFVAPGDRINDLTPGLNEQERVPVLILRKEQNEGYERFVVIADARFSALLASVHRNDEDDAGARGDEVIWTFEPDVVFTALEYLMARVTAERPLQAKTFTKAVRSNLPKATSLQLTVSVTTKLARLLQEQAEREIAINRIATAIRSSLELPSILQTTVEELGHALGVEQCALWVEGEHNQPHLMNCYFRDGEKDQARLDQATADIHSQLLHLAQTLESHVIDGSADAKEQETNIRPLAVAPLIYDERLMGALMVRSDDPTRVWQESELLLLGTVAGQLTVAVDHARLFAQIQQQALTDALTGCFNRRSFEMQLERDLHLATRMRQPISLIMLDVDKFKTVNDSYGHEVGDAALRVVSQGLREELRNVDTAARFGGDEFAIILPQADVEGAMLVAERLRARVESMEVPGIGHVTASFGIATFPVHASSRNALVVTADRALYNAKHLGRNRVCCPPEDAIEPHDESPASDVFPSDVVPNMERCASNPVSSEPALT